MILGLISGLHVDPAIFNGKERAYWPMAIRRGAWRANPARFEYCPELTAQLHCAGRARRRLREGEMGSKPFYFGNAEGDQVRGSGWFVGQFVPAELGLRRQTEVELKWGIHPDGERRPQPWANQNGTTISVLVEGRLKVTFHVDGSLEDVILQTKGDYVIFGPQVVHSWEAIGDTIVLSVRFPSVEVGSQTADARRRGGGSSL